MGCDEVGTEEERRVTNPLRTIQGSNLAESLKGRKAYVVGLLMLVNGLYALITGDVPTYDNPNPVSADEAIRMVLEGLGFITVRAGIAKLE